MQRQANQILGDKLIAEGKTGVKAGEGVLKYGPMDEYVEKRNRRIIQMTSTWTSGKEKISERK